MRAFERVVVAVLCFGIWACVSTARTVPWVVDGQVLGEVRQVKGGAGYKYEYKDRQGRDVREELRDLNRELIDGPCVYENSYDEQDRLVSVHVLDRAGEPAITEGQWSTKKILYSTSAQGGKIVENRYYHPGESLTTTAAGFAIERMVFEPDSVRLAQIDFLTASATPASANYRDFHGVARVKFAYLKGIGTLCMASVEDPQGKVIGRARISGKTNSVLVTQNQNYYY